MGEQTDSSVGRGGRIDAGVKAAFLAAVAGGATLEDAARAAGASLGGLYRARRRDPGFRRDWEETRQGARIAARHAVTAERAERRRMSRCPACREAAARQVVVAGNQRRVQLRALGHVRFTAERQEVYLGHLANTADHTAASAAAGVHPSTVWQYRRRVPEFEARWQQTLETAYAALEAEAVRQRLAMAARMRDAPVPSGANDLEFERVLKLLAHWRRKDGSIGPRATSRDRGRRYTFEESFGALVGKLEALGYRPDWDGARADATGEDGGGGAA